jgi:hypothetical protein
MQANSRAGMGGGESGKNLESRRARHTMFSSVSTENF